MSRFVLLPDCSSVGFDVDSARKDLRAMLAEAKARNIELPLAVRTLAAFDEVSEKGWGERDASSLAVYWSAPEKVRLTPGD